VTTRADLPSLSLQLMIGAANTASGCTCWFANQVERFWGKRISRRDCQGLVTWVRQIDRA
jgi:hypothetical protein